MAEEDFEELLASSPVLDRVVPLAVTAPAMGGGRVVVTAIELWSIEICIHHTAIGQEIKLETEAELQLRARHAQALFGIEDDLGNVYRLRHGGGGGSSGLIPIMRMTTVFEGPIVPAATSVRFYVNQLAEPVVLSLAP